MCCLNNKKKLNKKNLPVLHGKADFNVSIEVTAEKLVACVQTSPISFVARGKGNKRNRRRLHAELRTEAKA